MSKAINLLHKIYEINKDLRRKLKKRIEYIYELNAKL